MTRHEAEIIERCAKVAADFKDYTWRGHEGENSPSGMFARGNKHAAGKIAALLRALSQTTPEER